MSSTNFDEIFGILDGLSSTEMTNFKKQFVTRYTKKRCKNPLTLEQAFSLARKEYYDYGGYPRCGADIYFGMVFDEDTFRKLLLLHFGEISVETCAKWKDAYLAEYSHRKQQWKSNDENIPEVWKGWENFQ